MRWIADPPCTVLKVVRFDEVGGVLELKGPATSERVKGGIAAAAGAGFAAFAAPFLRLPFPPVFKAIPAAFVAIGTGMGALGLSHAVAQVGVQLDRKKGATFTWRLGALPQRSLTVAPEEIDAFEITTHETSVGDEPLTARSITSYKIHLVTKGGRDLAFEGFGLKTIAHQRKAQAESIFNGAPAARKRKSA